MYHMYIRIVQYQAAGPTVDYSLVVAAINTVLVVCVLWEMVSNGGPNESKKGII